MKIKHILDHGCGHRESRKFLAQHTFIRHNERYREVDLKPTRAHELQESKSITTIGAQSSNENVRINDDLRHLHSRIICTTCKLKERAP